MILRKATAKDLPQLVGLLADDDLGKQREDFRIPLPKVYEKAFDAIHTDTNQELMVAVEEDEVIGMLQLTFIQYLTYQGGLRAQIEGVRVHKSKRGKGLGKEMFQWAIHRAKQKGAHVLQLTSDKKRPQALQFYRDLGFIASHEGFKMHL